MGPLVPLFWMFGDICPGFQSLGGSPYFNASSAAHRGILRFTSGATPADLLVASMVDELFSSTYLQTSIGGAEDHDISCIRLAHSVMPGRQSTDGAMPARQLFPYFIWSTYSCLFISDLKI